MEKIETLQQPDNSIWKKIYAIWKIAFALVCLALVCAGIIGYGFIYAKTPTASFEYLDNIVSPENLGYLVSYGIVNGLIIWGIFYALIIRKRGAVIKGFSFIAIFVCLELSCFFGFLKHSSEAMRAHSEIQNQYLEFVNASIDSQNVPKVIEKPINTIPKAHGEFGEMERFVKEFLNQFVSQRNDYLLEVKAIGWDSLLDMNRLKADKTFAESRVKIRKARENVKRFKEQTDILYGNLDEKIAALNISERTKSKMLSNFNQGMEMAKKDLDTLLPLEDKIIDEFENIIDLLSERKGAWVIDGEHISFNNDNDLERFDSYISAIQKIANRQEDFKRQNAQTSNAT